MTWYAVHDDAGQLVSVGTVLSSPLAPGLTAVALTSEPDLLTQQWDSDSRSFVARAVAKSMDPFDFISRFTIEEEAAIRAAAHTDPMIETLLSRLSAPTLTRVVFDDPTLLQGLAYLQTVNDANGQPLLTDARVLELLA